MGEATVQRLIQEEIVGSFLSKVITSVAFVRNVLPEVWG